MHHDVRFESDPHAVVINLPLGEGPAPDRIVIDDAHFLFTAHFKKSGADLILTDDGGKKLVLVGYFNFEKRPDLVSSQGAILPADLVGHLAGPDAPARYAQASAPAGAQVIGRVELLGSIATVQHSNGAVENLMAGDALLKGDVVMTGDDSSLTLSLVDGTALNMGANARMVLTELIYDSNSTSNSGVINLVKGTFTFVAGQVAHTGGMQVATPVATMGIRGTSVGAYLDADVNGNVYQFTATLLSDPGGGNGLYDVVDPVTGAVLYTVRSTTTQVTFSTTPSNQIMVQEASKSAAIVQHELATAQILFPIFLSNPANMQGGQQTPQPHNDSLTPPQDQPQPPPTEDSTALLQVTFAKITTSTDKVTATNNPQLLFTELVNQNALPTAGIAIAPVDGNNIINLARAQSGFAISGSEAGADGQIVTVTIFDGSGKLVGSYTTVAAGGSWSVTVPPAYAATLADGIYTIKATVLDPLGNPPAIATQTIAVDQTPPVLTVAAINGDNLLNRAGAQAGFAISGTEVGADGQPVTVFILDHSGNVVATYTTLAGTGGWSVNVSAAYATALADGAYTVEAVVSDAAGNPSAPATEVIAVHETGPNVAIAAITGDNIVNRSEAQAGFVISGSETGADAQAVTITILDSSGHAVDKYTTTAAGGAWSVQVTPAEAIALADGSYRVTAATSDTFGNQGITTQTLTVDQTPPTVTIAAITGDNVVNLSEAQTGFVIAGTETGADGQTITVQIVDHANRVVETYTTTGAGGTWSVNVSSADATALADGTYTVTASVSDPAGNPAATTQTFTVDETPPTITVAPITGDNVINLSEAQAGFAIGGSEIGADGQTVTITILDGTGHAVDKYTTTAAGGAWSVSVSSADATALLDGTYAVTATVSDAAGNPASARQTITVDETPPTITIAAVTGDNVINLSEAQAGFTLNGNETGADGQVVTIAILNGEGRVIDSYTATAAGGAWSVNVSTADATALADGSYKAVAGVSDAAGNSATASQPFSVDETPPTIGIAAVTGDNVINLSEAQAGFAIGGGETRADGRPVTVTILDNAGHVINSYTTVATGGTWSVNVSSADATALADGTYTVTASVSDAAGNPASATQTLKVDETPPTIGIAPITGDDIVNLSEARAGFAISGSETGADGQAVTVHILNSSNQVVDSYMTVASAGTWSVTVSSANATALADGTYTVTASVLDAAGNPASATQTLRVDETLPTIAIATIAGDNVVNLSEAQAGFAIGGSETGADGQTVTVRVINNSNQIIDTYTTVATAGTWSVNVSSADATALADGTYQVIANVSDAAGNAAPQATRTLSVDETLPNVAISGISPDTGSSHSDGITNAAVVTVSGIAEANSTVEVFDDGTPVGTTTANSAGQWSLPNVALSAGINHLTATATDIAGNSSAAQASFVATLDTGEQVTVSLNGLTGGSALEDRTITAIVSAANNDVPSSGVNYTWSVSHDGGNTWSTVGGNSSTYTPSESDEGGLLRVVASFIDVAGNLESGSAVVGVLPLLTIADNTLSVAPNGSVPLGIGLIQEPTPDDTMSVTISFNAGAHAPTISAVDGATGHPVTTAGITTYTFALADVSSGLNFTNHGDQSDVVTVGETINGNTLGSTQTITVTDPPVSALKVNSGTFALNNSSLQTSLISIALAGTFLVEQGTYALSMPIENNGQFILDSNGTTVDITGALSGLGSFTINAGATLQFGAGTHTISGSTTDNGKVEVTDGTLEIAGATSGSGSLQVDAGAALQLDGADSLNVTFTGSTGKLILKDPGNFSGTISGLTGSDQIDLANVNWQAAQVSSVNYSATTNVTTLVITDGQHISTILLVGDYTSSTWTFSSDGSGGTIVVDPLKTVVALSVTDSTGVVDTTTSSSDLAQSSSAMAAATDATTGDASHAPTAEALIFSAAGLDFLSEHIRFEDTDARPTAAVSVFASDSSSGSHSGLLWLADFVHGAGDDHFATLVPPDGTLNLRSNYDSQSAKPGVAHVELENSYDGGKNPSFIDLSSQAAPHISSTVAVGNPNDSVAQPSLPIPAVDVPPSDRDASPPTDHLQTDADQHVDDAPEQAKAHVASETPAADRGDQDPVTVPTVASDRPAFDHTGAPTADPDPGHAGLTRHTDDLPSRHADQQLSNTSADDKPAFDHNDAANGDSNVRHAGLEQLADDLSSQPVEHKLSGTSEDDKPAFERTDASTVDSKPGHVDATARHDGPPSQSAERQLSDTSDDGGAAHPHQSLSPIATATLADDVTQGAAHSAHAHGDSAPQPIQLSSAAAPLPSSEIVADGAAHHSGSPSLQSLAQHPAFDTAGHAADPLSAHADAVPQPIAATTRAATPSLASYMTSLPTDQFQFQDLNTHNSHKVTHDADLIANPATTQTLLEATTPIDHSASLHDIATIPGTELLISHSHQAAAHAHNGII